MSKIFDFLNGIISAINTICDAIIQTVVFGFKAIETLWQMVDALFTYFAFLPAWCPYSLYMLFMAIIIVALLRLLFSIIP